MADNDPPEVKEAKNKQTIAEAQSAQYKAEKDAADARAAAVKSQFGSIEENKVAAGGVTADSGAGDAEASMLSAKSADLAATKIAEAVNRLVSDSGTNIVVIAGSEKLSLGHYQLYRMQLRVLDEAFRRADAAKTAADADYDANPPAGGKKMLGVGTESAAAVAGIGAALDLAAKIASYFQTEYKFGTAKVNGVDDAMLGEAVAGKLTAKALFPGRWSGTAVLDAFTEELEKRAHIYATSLTSLNQVQARSEVLKDAGKNGGSEAEKKQWARLAARYDETAEIYKAAQKNYDALILSLADPDPKGKLPVAALAEEKFVAEALAKPNTYVLFVRMNYAAGANYTKKNIWTFLGAMPFHVMGGVITSFVLVDGASGRVKGSGQFTFASDYLSVADVKDALQ